MISGTPPLKVGSFLGFYLKSTRTTLLYFDIASKTIVIGRPERLK
jgi:hypothetical protein